MTISAAFNSAMSGLTAASRASGLVSENIANALTPGYARRSLEVTSNLVTGRGVQVVGVTRHTDPVLVANRRAADSAHGSASTLSGFHTNLENLIGRSGSVNAISTRLSTFENSLLTAASLPDSATRLDGAAAAAKDLALSLNKASDGLQDARTRADRGINTQVNRLNDVLQSVQDLNARIQTVGNQTGNTATLLDQRQLLIDEINEMIPVNVINRENGKVALYSEGGAILVDGSAAKLSFAPVNETRPHMTVENGLLSGLQINDVPVRTSGNNNAIRGGSLAAQFEIRDVLATDAQQDLDAVAQDLIERFEAAGVDPTHTPGQPGLFTDAGAALGASAGPGLAGRLALNSAVDPSQGGQSWKLRAGLEATDPGEPGDATLLKAFDKALTDSRPMSTDRFGTGALTAGEVSAGLLSRVTQNSNSAAQTLTFSAANKTEMERLELETGVDTDAELQSLMLVERAYAANARVVETVNELMDTLLRL